MVLMPPGSAKSTYTSVIFPTWWFSCHPRTSIIAASHSSALAQHFSRRARALIDAKHAYLGFRISLEQRSSTAWKTSTGGEYLALGVRGAIAGRRADLVIIDDPIKSQADAESAKHRDHVWEWYRSDITPRLKPGGKVVLIMTRWHPEDLGGQLLDAAPDEWRVLRLPALAEANDPLGRAVGEPLWPDWEDYTALLRKRDLIGERVWAALYQQTPLDVRTRIFAVDRIAISAAPGALDGRLIRAWDLAATNQSGANDPDWTVGVKLLRDRQGRYVLLDVVRLRGTPRQVEDAIIETAVKDGAKVPISLPEDPGQAGKAQISYLTRQLSGFQVLSSRETGSKATRAMPLASQVEAGNVSIAAAFWNRAFLEEMREFPKGRKDDQVDALVRAFTALTDQPRAPASVAIPLLNR